MADAYAARAVRVAVAQLAEAAGFEAAQQSSLDTLADLLLRYINEVGSASHGYAELAGRTESTPLDVVRCRGSRHLPPHIVWRFLCHSASAPHPVSPPHPGPRSCWR